MNEIPYLGRIVSENGVAVDPSNVNRILQMEPPKNVSEVRSLMGSLNYVKEFVPAFARIAVPLTNLLKKNQAFVWNPACLDAFQELKSLLTKAPVLVSPDPKLPYLLTV